MDSGVFSKLESQGLTGCKKSVKDNSVEKREGWPCHQLRQRTLQAEQIWSRGRIRISVLDTEFEMPARRASNGI